MSFNCDHCENITDKPIPVQSGINVVQFLCDNCYEILKVKDERVMEAPFSSRQGVCQVCGLEVSLLGVYYNSKNLLVCYSCLYKAKLNKENIVYDGLQQIKNISDVYHEPGSSFFLAKLYLGGIGVDRDHEEAAKYFKIAAANGNAESLYILGCMYTDFYGGNIYFVKKDDKYSLECLSKSAELGNYEAQYLLYVCYKDGSLVSTNESMSKKMFSSAISTIEGLIAKGNKSLILMLGQYWLEIDNKKAKSTFEKGIELGNPACMYEMALILFEEGDKKRAELLFRESAKLGDINAATYLEDQGDFYD